MQQGEQSPRCVQVNLDSSFEALPQFPRAFVVNRSANSVELFDDISRPAADRVVILEADRAIRVQLFPELRQRKDELQNPAVILGSNVENRLIVPDAKPQFVGTRGRLTPAAGNDGKTVSRAQIKDCDLPFLNDFRADGAFIQVVDFNFRNPVGFIHFAAISNRQAER